MIGYVSIMQYDIGGGIHWYGTLRIKDGSQFDVKHTLDAATARRLNKDDRHRQDTPTYRPGHETQRFISRESCLTAAMKMAAEMGVTWLLEGSGACCDPQHVLIGPEPLKTKLNKLWQEAESINGWDGREKGLMQNICDRWDVLWNPIRKQKP